MVVILYLIIAPKRGRYDFEGVHFFALSWITLYQTSPCHFRLKLLSHFLPQRRWHLSKLYKVQQTQFLRILVFGLRKTDKNLVGLSGTTPENLWSRRDPQILLWDQPNLKLQQMLISFSLPYLANQSVLTLHTPFHHLLTKICPKQPSMTKSAQRYHSMVRKLLTSIIKSREKINFL